MAFLYGFGFRSLGKKNEAVSNTSVHAHTKTNQRR
jgi:hypothetical protein